MSKEGKGFGEKQLQEQTQGLEEGRKVGLFAGGKHSYQCIYDRWGDAGNVEKKKTFEVLRSLQL